MLPDWFELLGLMKWPLAVCAVLTLALCLERMMFIFKSLRQRKKQMRELMSYLKQHRKESKPVRDEMAGLMLHDLQEAYLSGIKLLRVIGAISPIIGLLGTILGIISAFKDIAIQTGPVSPSLIANGLWEAMLTTAVGLIIALPALLMAHGVKIFSESALRKFCRQLNHLSLSFELERK